MTSPWKPLSLAVAGVAALALYSQNSPPVASAVTAAQGASFRLMFGMNDSQPATWDGSLRLSEGEVAGIEGWQFTATDAVEDKSAWKLATRFSPPGYRESLQQLAHGPMYPNGFLVSLTGVTGATEARVHTAQGDFTFRLHDAPWGETKRYLDGRVELRRVPTTTQLTTALTDEDFPAAVQTPDGLAAVYIAHSGDPGWTSWTGITQAPDFDTLAKPTGGDQVMLMRFDKSRRTWSSGEPVSPTRLDCMGAAIARDGKGRLWAFWSARHGENYDLYASFHDGGKWSRQIPLTSDPGTDIHPVAATDTAGRVWVAWQGFRNGSLDVLVAVQQGNAFSREQTVSFSGRSDWAPAIAASPNGDIAIAWDTYDKGDYDVYMRRLRYKDGIAMDAPVAVAASPAFEARPSIACDAQGRLWVAYETGPPRWGKNFGTYDTTGTPLYAGQNVEVKCFRGDALLTTADDPRELLGRSASFPDPQLAKNRQPNNAIRPPSGARNSMPRLAVAPDGQLYLGYRVEDAGRTSAGQIWSERVLWWDGDRWRGPVLVPHTDGTLDNRPVLAALDGGRLWMLAASDHRQAASPGRRGVINSDLYAAEFNFDTKPQSGHMAPVPAVAAAAPEAENKVEADQVRQLQDYHAGNLRLLRGEFHRHTALSPDGGDDGPIEDAYRYLIDAANMDWAGCCDHDNGANEYSWWLEQKLNDAYHLGARFVTMYSYERSVLYPEGHRNVIFAQRGIRPLARLPKVSTDAPFAPAPDTQMFYQYLRHFSGVTAAHQTTTVGGTDWRNNDPAVETSVEIFEGLRQSGERPDAPKAVTATDHVSGYFPAGYVSKALEKGYRLAFESSSDHFSTHESYTLLWATEPTRAGVLDAFHKRHLYAASDNILADVRCGAHIMGDDFSVTSPPELAVKLIGTAPFTQIHIVKDNQYVYQSQPNARTVEFTWRDGAAAKGKTSFYYVRGVQADGGMVWASPMWIRYEPVGQAF
jgi:hypothetical protein